MFYLHRFYLLFAKEGKYADVFFRVFVGTVQPELIKGIWRGAFGIEPDVSGFGLPEFPAVGLGDKRTSKSKGLTTKFPANEFGSGYDVAPLI